MGTGTIFSRRLGRVLWAAAVGLAFVPPVRASVEVVVLPGAPAGSRVFGAVAIGQRVFVSVGAVDPAADFATVYVWNNATESFDGQVDLTALVATPLGGRGIATDGMDVWVGSAPEGRIFRIDGSTLTATDLDSPPAFKGDTLTEVTALTVAGGQVYAGGVPTNDSTAAVVYVFSTGAATAGGASAIPLRTAPDSTFLDAHARSVRALFADSSGVVWAGVEGRTETGTVLFRISGTTPTLDTTLPTDSAVAAIGAFGDSLYYVAEPTGTIYLRASGADSVPLGRIAGETTAFSFGVGPDTDAADSRVLFLASDTATVFRTPPDSAAAADTFVPRFVVPGTTRTSALVATFVAPLRLYGGGEDAGGTPFLWFYDVFPPSVVEFRFRPLAPPLQQPTTPEDFPPPLTRGAYQITFELDERAAVLPVVTATFADASVDALPVSLSTNDTAFTATLVIEEADAKGEVVIAIAVEDTAGNRAVRSPPDASFENVSIGTIRVAQNRFRPSLGEHATVRLFLPQPSHVRIRIYNFRGMLLRTLLDGRLPAGSNDVVWDGRGDHGQFLASGVYLLRIEVDGRVETHRVETHKVMMIR